MRSLAIKRPVDLLNEKIAQIIVLFLSNGLALSMSPTQITKPFQGPYMSVNLLYFKGYLINVTVGSASCLRFF